MSYVIMAWERAGLENFPRKGLASTEALRWKYAGHTQETTRRDVAGRDCVRGKRH